MGIVGNVYWIEKGVQTTKLVDAKVAFGDPDQAKAQVQFAEASGDKKQIRLTRLAFRQYQGMRFRNENRDAPNRATRAAKLKKPNAKLERRQSKRRKR